MWKYKCKNSILSNCRLHKKARKVEKNIGSFLGYLIASVCVSLWCWENYVDRIISIPEFTHLLNILCNKAKYLWTALPYIYTKCASAWQNLQ